MFKKALHNECLWNTAGILALSYILFSPRTLLMSLLPSLMSPWPMAMTRSSVHGQFTWRSALVLESEVHVGDVRVRPVVSDEDVLHVHLAARRLAPDR